MLWFHRNRKKFTQQGYKGSYEFKGTGKNRQRFLVLTGEKNGRRIEIESAEEARADGWYQAEQWGAPSEAEPARPRKTTTRPDGTKISVEVEEVE